MTLNPPPPPPTPPPPPPPPQARFSSSELLRNISSELRGSLRERGVRVSLQTSNASAYRVWARLQQRTQQQGGGALDPPTPRALSSLSIGECMRFVLVFENAESCYEALV